MDKLLTPDDLATRWGMARKTIYQRISEGCDMPKSVLIGSRRRFRFDDILKWEKSHEDDSSVY